MQNSKRLVWMLSAISCFLLSSCDTPQPPDVPACEQLSQYLTKDPVTDHDILNPSPTCEAAIGEPECGHCVYMVSGKEIFIGELEAHQFNKKPWSKLKRQAVYLPAVESFSPVEKYMINACHKMQCNDQIDRFKVKLDSLNGVADAIKGQ
jgi:hypothetical protein